MPARPVDNRIRSKKNQHVLAPAICIFIDKISDPVLALDLDGKICARNEAFKNHSRFITLNTMSDDELSAQLKPAIVKPSNAHGTELDKTTCCDEPVCRFSFKDTHGKPYSYYLYPNIIPDNVIVIFEQYSDEDLLQRVLDCIPARVFWKDNNSAYLGGNHLFLSDCGFEKHEDMIGKTDYEVFLDEEADGYVADDKEVIASGQAKLNIEECQTTPDGELLWLQTSKVPILNKENEVIGVMGSYTDITERKNYQAMIERQAHYDQLTGLQNRQALQEYVVNFAQCKNHKYGGLLFIDLDNFKTVNDTLGHAIGDELLKLVSQRIVKASDENDFVCRLGGDEFAIVSQIEATEQTKKPDQKLLQKNIDTLSRSVKNTILKPYLVDSHYIQLGVSIGITYFDSSYIDWANTFNEADMAMYEAKSSGRNTIKMFSETIREQTNHIHRMQALLNKSIENEELYLNIQPQFGKDNELIGAEALLRWHNNELGEISPVEFIPISEQSGTIHSIGLWVFEEAFKLVELWCQQYDADKLPPLAVNVSPVQFQSSDFLSSVQRLLQQYRINPSLIHFELTESLLVENEDSAIDKLRALSDLGFPLSIDDFGTGYSCLSYLNQLPIDKIKIDKSFTLKVTEDRKQAALVDTIISMAKSLEMSVIAEGVETKEQLEFLKAHGCYEYQGYHFSRPIAVTDYQALLQADPSILERKI